MVLSSVSFPSATGDTDNEVESESFQYFFSEQTSEIRLHTKQKSTPLKVLIVFDSYFLSVTILQVDGMLNIRDLILLFLLGIGFQGSFVIASQFVFSLPVSFLHTIVMAGGHAFLTIFWLLRCIVDSAYRNRLVTRSHSLFLSKLPCGVVASLTMFAVLGDFILKVLQSIDAEVVSIILPVHFVLCCLFNFRSMETLPLCIITVGFLIVLLAIRIDETAIPDFMSIVVLLFVVVCFAVGNWIHCKFMSSFNSGLVTLVEILTSLLASLVVLLSKMSKESVIAAFSETTLSENMPLVVLSVVVVPFIVFAGRLLLQSSGLRTFVCISLVPLACSWSLCSNIAGLAIGTIILLAGVVFFVSHDSESPRPRINQQIDKAAAELNKLFLLIGIDYCQAPARGRIFIDSRSGVKSNELHPISVDTHNK
jgi:hypothetical protein